jgi:hypothetical protein
MHIAHVGIGDGAVPLHIARTHLGGAYWHGTLGGEGRMLLLPGELAGIAKTAPSICDETTSELAGPGGCDHCGTKAPRLTEPPGAELDRSESREANLCRRMPQVWPVWGHE